MCQKERDHNAFVLIERCLPLVTVSVTTVVHINIRCLTCEKGTQTVKY